jgi:CHAT domain-containing protein
MLAARDLTLSSDLPPSLETERRILKHQYDAAQQDILLGKGTKDQLLGINSKLNEVARQIDRLSPRLSAIRDPKPLDLETSGKSLDPGTAMLYYDVGREETRLWIVEAGGTVRLDKLRVTRRQLEEAVGQYRFLIQGTRGTGSLRLVSLIAAGKQLYETLVAPAEEALARSKRILIVPDGPLRLLPFSGLIRSPIKPDETLGGRGWQFLSEWKPIHTTLSATLFAELKVTRHSSRESSLPNNASIAALGDPLFAAGLTRKSISIEDPWLRSAAKHGFDFTPLVFSRQEVERIVSLFPRGTKAFLGAAATEENVKSLPRDTRIVHFATHAILDERFPLNSAVVLSIPEKLEEGKDNGLLQAWEIFEKVRIDADLVVLSACESGLGKEMGGEGLIGLTRAFQYAGARSVMASLWKISDRTTPELMVRFYKHLKAGLSKDEALRAAQMELIQGPIRVKNEKGEEEVVDATAPYYWAAFQIYGDWQ